MILETIGTVHSFTRQRNASDTLIGRSHPKPPLSSQSLANSLILRTLSQYICSPSSLSSMVPQPLLPSPTTRQSTMRPCKRWRSTLLALTTRSTMTTKACALESNTSLSKMYQRANLLPITPSRSTILIRLLAGRPGNSPRRCLTRLTL